MFLMVLGFLSNIQLLDETILCPPNALFVIFSQGVAWFLTGKNCHCGSVKTFIIDMYIIGYIGAFKKQETIFMCAGQDLIFPFLMHDPENQLFLFFFGHVLGDQNLAFALTASIVVKMGLQINKK